jgi:transposase
LITLRKKELKKLKSSISKEEYLALKPAISLLCKRKECEISDEEKRQLQPLFEVSPRIKEGYNLCLKLTSIYNRHSTSADAAKLMDGWIIEVESSKLICFKDCIKTLQKYKQEICNYFINRHSSGFVESFNNKAKVLKRRCYGLTNIKHVFQRLFLDFPGYKYFATSSELLMA